MAFANGPFHSSAHAFGSDNAHAVAPPARARSSSLQRNKDKRAARPPRATRAASDPGLGVNPGGGLFFMP
jgi:hypothetical protein